MSQSENLKRVTEKIGPVVLEFVKQRFAYSPVFTIRELHDYVVKQTDIAPASPDRILRHLRKLGHFMYEVENRRKSQYRVTAVYDSPNPEATKPKVDPVREICGILMDKKVDLDDKFAVFVTLGDILFPDEDVFRRTQVVWLVELLCDRCLYEGTVIDILEVCLRQSLIPPAQVKQLTTKFGVSLAGVFAELESQRVAQEVKRDIDCDLNPEAVDKALED